MSKSRPFSILAFSACVFALAGCISLGDRYDRGKVHVESIKPADHWYTVDDILMIPLEGMVTEGSMRTYTGQPGMLVELKDRLDAARKNKMIKAVVLRISSPGGTVTASELIHHEIMRFKKETKLPVIAILGDEAASGGYYIATAADEIYALPTTLTGSIGVIFPLPGVKKLGDKIGVEMRVIKSGANKDIASPWNEMSAEQREILQGMIDGYFKIFLKRVTESREPRGLQPSRLRELADGRVFSPDVALKARLIDGIKYPDEVYDRAKELAKIRDARIISYEYRDTYRGHIYANASEAKPAAGNLNLINIDMGQPFGTQLAPQFLYMWIP